jgi:hypothetical protein
MQGHIWCLSIYLSNVFFWLMIWKKWYVIMWIGEEKEKTLEYVYVFTIKVNVRYVRMLFDVVNVRYRMHIYIYMYVCASSPNGQSQFDRFFLSLLFFLQLFYHWVHADNRFEINSKIFTDLKIKLKDIPYCIIQTNDAITPSYTLSICWSIN